MAVSIGLLGQSRKSDIEAVPETLDVTPICGNYICVSLDEDVQKKFIQLIPKSKKIASGRSQRTTLCAALN